MLMTSTTLNMSMMKNSPQLLSYDIASGVRAFSTMRHGGVGEGAYCSFNINSYCGDSQENIAANKASLAETLGIEPTKILLPHQVHGADFCIIAPDFMALSEEERAKVIEGVDGIFTSMSGVCIGVSTADCIPIIIYDPEHHAACAIHAGWRGTVKRIASKAVAEMQTTYHSNAEKLKAVIGPGILLKSFEVGQEVYDQFASAGFDMNGIAKQMGKWHIDLPECNRRELVAAGIPAENIKVSGIDTYTSNDFFSARRQGINSGRIYTAIIMEETK